MSCLTVRIVNLNFENIDIDTYYESIRNMHITKASLFNMFIDIISFKNKLFLLINSS